jgi:hypothetical protein
MEENNMCALSPMKVQRISSYSFTSFDKLVCLCVWLLIMAPAHAMKVDSFNVLNQRTISGTDYEQITSLDGSVVADRYIGLSEGGPAALTGTQLDLPGGTIAEITYDFGMQVDLSRLNLAGDAASAFGIDFFLSDNTIGMVKLMIIANESFEFLEQSYSGDGFHRAFFGFNDIPTTLDLEQVTSMIISIQAINGVQTFSLDEFETVASVPLPPTVLLFGSGLLGLIRISRRNWKTA